MCLKYLSFGYDNAKFNAGIATFSIPAGWSCPFALECLSKANRKTGAIKDGKDTKYRCFSATMEARMPSIRISRWNNLKLLQACQDKDQMIDLILRSWEAARKPQRMAKIMRVHVGGDFFSQRYFDAWMEVARLRQDRVFYAYTKAIPHWVEHINTYGTTPSNFKLVASYGGTADYMIRAYGLRHARVVYSLEHAERLGLEIDHDDSHAYASDRSFALLVHGTQPAGSEAGKAIRKLIAAGHNPNYGKATVAA